MQTKPSLVVMGIRDAMARYCLDGAVMTFGMVVENALLERIEVGSGKTMRRVPKYTLRQILADGFTFPRQRDEDDAEAHSGPADGETYDEVR